MKILLTGGGSGGHFYPAVSVAREIKQVARDEKLLEPQVIYMAPEPYDERLLFDRGIEFIKVPAGKWRRYRSIKNFFNIFSMGWGIIKAFVRTFIIFPDVVFMKGGGAGLPALIAARFFRIPVVVHESDTVPGRANKWAGKFARRVAVGFPETVKHFDADKTAYTGIPVRREVQHPETAGAHEFLNLEANVPVLLVLGGSQGAAIINETLLDALPRLVDEYQIIHQTGVSHLTMVERDANVVLQNSRHRDRYHTFGYLDLLTLRMAAGAADLVICRSGATTIAEVAAWGLPSILIPISDSNGDHARKNASSFARTGAAIVIEEHNLSPSILIAEIQRIMGDQTMLAGMAEAARGQAQPDAAQTIAREIINIALEHEL